MTKTLGDLEKYMAGHSDGPGLVICRNKHWKYISCYHGPWFQLPPELLASMAHENYIMPQPRLIDPAVFYDIARIRAGVDEAMEEVVRANHGTTLNGASRLDSFSVGNGPPAAKMSKERVHKVRQKAVKLLAKAYELDEIATSVMTMQSSSSVDDIAAHVLKRDRGDMEAKYVHFFHEKVPSRNMEKYTSTAPLGEIIGGRTWQTQAPVLRTRGVVSAMKQDYEAAIEDFTLALQLVQEAKIRRQRKNEELVLAKQFVEEQDDWGRYVRSIPMLKEDEQPSSLEQQVLFNRAGVYLTLACESVDTALNGLKEFLSRATDSPGEDPLAGLSTEELQKHQDRLEARKRVKTFAKRACKDYMAFIAFFDYSPGYQTELAREIMQRIQDQTKDYNLPAPDLISDNPHALARRTPNKPSTTTIPSPAIHPASSLFAEKQDANLTHSSSPNVREAITYHPLLCEALHSLLLCHALAQTSPTELHRHALSAARLLRIADGHPLFAPARSPARADWIELLRRTGNWVNLTAPWGKLCSCKPATKKEVTPEQRRQDAVREALGDEKVVDEETFALAVAKREELARVEEERDGMLFAPEAERRRGEVLEYPVFSERAGRIARWVLEAPGAVVGEKRRRRKKK